MSNNRVDDVRFALSQAQPPPVPAGSPASVRIPIAAVSGAPLGAVDLDTVDVGLVVDVGYPPLVTVTVWDGAIALAATAALPLPIARRVRDALDEAIARGEAADQQERQGS